MRSVMHQEQDTIHARSSPGILTPDAARHQKIYCEQVYLARADLEARSKSRLLRRGSVKVQVVHPACQGVYTPPQGSLHCQSLIIQLQHHNCIQTCRHACISYLAVSHECNYPEVTPTYLQACLLQTSQVTFLQ